MNEVILYGDMKERYGESFKLDVHTPYEAIRGMSQLRGFRELMRSGEFVVVREAPNGTFIMDEHALILGMENSKLHILPSMDGAANGQKGKGTAKIILGIALIGASLFIPGMQAAGLTMKAAWATKIAGTGIAYGSMALAGVALALGGAALLIAPQPKLETGSSEDQKQSFVFNGAYNTSGQGDPVWLSYGLVLGGSKVVASRLVTEDLLVPTGTNYENIPQYALDQILG